MSQTVGLEGQKTAKNRYEINHTLGYKHGCCIYAKLRKVQALYAKKISSRASSDTYQKGLLGPDQDLVFTFSNPTLKSALQDLYPMTLVASKTGHTTIATSNFWELQAMLYVKHRRRLPKGTVLSIILAYSLRSTLLGYN